MRTRPNQFKKDMYWGAIPTDNMPWLDDHSNENFNKMAYLERRERVLMRGVKIGQRKGMDAVGKFSLFNTKKNAPSTTV